MNDQLRANLQVAYECCADDDCSIEFTIQYMQDVTGATYDQVIDFLEQNA